MADPNPNDVIRELGVLVIATARLDRHVDTPGGRTKLIQAGAQIPALLLPWQPAALIGTIVDMVNAKIERVLVLAGDHEARVEAIRVEVLPAAVVNEAAAQGRPIKGVDLAPADDVAVAFLVTNEPGKAVRIEEIPSASAAHRIAQRMRDRDARRSNGYGHTDAENGRTFDNDPNPGGD